MARDPEIDELTLRRAAAGDTRAATAFVKRYERVVFVTAARVLGARKEDVADVAQETFLRALPALASFDAAGSARVSTWLCTIAVRVALDVARRRRRVVSLDEARVEQAEAREPSPDDALDAARTRARLAAAMEKLGPEQRAVVVLRVEHEMPLADIASTLGVEIGTVKSRFARAKATLAAALASAETEDRHAR